MRRFTVPCSAMRRAIPVVVMVAAIALAGAARVEAATNFTYTVNSTGDTNDTNLNDQACDGTCTLRSAIEQANFNCNKGPANPAISTTIRFAIPGSGVHTITPFPVTSGTTENHPAALPVIGCPVVIDGTSQGGAGYTGPPLIELDGSVAASTQLAPGLAFGGNDNGSTVRGLIVNRWHGAGLQFTGRGGSTVNASFLVQGNYIGTDATGTRALPNTSDGITVSGAARATIGGTTTSERNLVSGNGGRGVVFGPGGSAGSLVQGNFIGTDVAGTHAIGNSSDGVLINGDNGTVIGGTTAGAGNVISGNGGNGLSSTGNLVGSTQIIGNRIGTTADGTGRLGNATHGVVFTNNGGNDVVGGTGAGAANVIAFNGQAGVTVAGGLGHKISGNSIFENGSIGINLAPCVATQCNGPDVNDAGDGDTGPNQYQNFPVISSVTSTSTASTIKGTLNSTANATFTIELFSSPACDDSGYGEGKTYLGSTSVTTSGNDASFTVTVNPRVAGSSAVTATATDATGNTSEFSACQAAPK